MNKELCLKLTPEQNKAILIENKRYYAEKLPIFGFPKGSPDYKKLRGFFFNRSSQVKKHGLTLYEFDELWAHQHGLCAVCGEPVIESRFQVIDHDHVTGRVRAILCHECNPLLGKLGENKKPQFGLLMKITSYIYTHVDKNFIVDTFLPFVIKLAMPALLPTYLSLRNQKLTATIESCQKLLVFQTVPDMETQQTFKSEVCMTT